MCPPAWLESALTAGQHARTCPGRRKGQGGSGSRSIQITHLARPPALPAHHVRPALGNGCERPPGCDSVRVRWNPLIPLSWPSHVAHKNLVYQVRRRQSGVGPASAVRTESGKETGSAIKNVTQLGGPPPQRATLRAPINTRPSVGQLVGRRLGSTRAPSRRHRWTRQQ